jgi:integrase
VGQELVSRADLLPASFRRLTPEQIQERIEKIASKLRELDEAALSPNTRKTYRSRWIQFALWCQEMDADPWMRKDGAAAYDRLLSAYVGWLAERKASPSTITVSLSAIKRYNADQGFDVIYGTQLKKYVRGHANIEGRAPRVQAQAAVIEDLELMLSAFDFETPKPKDVRDRALLLLGFIGGFRRSELAGITLDRVRYDRRGKGIAIFIPKSKADQQGRGRTKVAYYTHTPLCPVAAYEAWVRLAGITEGPVFRAVRKGGFITDKQVPDKAIADMIRERAKAVGLIVNDDERWSGHSLRRGFVTEGIRKGIPRHQLMEDGGWTSNAIDGYYQAAKEFDDERAAARMGL